MTVWRLKHTVTSTVQAAKATKVTAAHHSVWRHLYDSMHATQKPKSKLKFVTLDKENNKSILWQREVFQVLRIYNKEDLAEKAHEIEVAKSKKKSRGTARPQSYTDPVSFVVNRFWGRRLDGVAINEHLQIVYILEFKRSTDRDS